ncbi:hypothetical protein FACS189476_02940 [Spirochaetia bacterium]|nr:hypothetical protein FACS189476_02940 [Spirochaetia bacterium]
MSMDNTQLGIKIVGALANIAAECNRTFNNQELATLLNMFNHQTSTGEKYVDSGSLVRKAIKKYTNDLDTITVKNIKTVFNKPDAVNISLLDK